MNNPAKPNLNDSKPKEEENYVKSLEEQIEKFEKYFEVISEVIDDLLKIKSSDKKKEELENQHQFSNKFCKNPLIHKRSMSFMIQNKPPSTTVSNEVDQFFSEKRKNKAHLSFGIRNKLDDIIFFRSLFF